VDEDATAPGCRVLRDGPVRLEDHPVLRDGHLTEAGLIASRLSLGLTCVVVVSDEGERDVVGVGEIPRPGQVNVAGTGTIAEAGGVGVTASSDEECAQESQQKRTRPSEHGSSPTLGLGRPAPARKEMSPHRTTPLPFLTPI